MTGPSGAVVRSSADTRTRTGAWIGLLRAERTGLLVCTCGHPNHSSARGARNCAEWMAINLGLTLATPD